MVRALQGQEETFEMYFRMEPPMFPAATLPFPSAGDLRFRAQGMWVARIPRVSLVSLALPWARFLLPRWGVRVNGVYYVRRVKSVKSDKSVFNTFPFSEIKNIGLL